MYEAFFEIFGWLSWPIIISTALTVILLAIAGYLGLRYTHKFYGDRPTPRSWILIVVALLAFFVAELGEFSVLLHVLPGYFEAIIELSAHAAAGIAMMLGCYCLYKEVCK
jgi:hypothetical protein